MNKYGNRKVVIDGIKFDSMREAAVYQDFVRMLKSGVIEELRLQVPFILQEGFKDENGACRPIKYIADFVVTHSDGLIEVIDVKGYETDVFKLKWKMLRKVMKHMDYKLTIMK